jgi:hypothetical protein
MRRGEWEIQEWTAGGSYAVSKVLAICQTCPVIRRATDFAGVDALCSVSRQRLLSGSRCQIGRLLYGENQLLSSKQKGGDEWPVEL